MVVSSGHTDAGRRLSRSVSTVAWRRLFSLGVRGSSAKMGKRNTMVAQVAEGVANWFHNDARARAPG
jgi:hypothetical protein